MEIGRLVPPKIVRSAREKCASKRPICGLLRPRRHGFTYIGLLVAIVVMGIGLAAVGPVSRTLQLREKERELLFVGDQYRRAIGMYYDKTPGPLKQYPKKLEDLLRDNRYPNVQRYLRRIYTDPLTGKKQWGLVELPGIGITGVYSLTDLPPIKTANFPAQYKSFQTAKKYSDWKFVYVPSQGASAPIAPTAPGAFVAPGASRAPGAPPSAPQTLPVR
jgi:type II secretory pathway pseudopilin PulG